MLPNNLLGNYGNSLAVDMHGQELSPGIEHGLFHFFSGIRLDQEHKAASTTRAANFAGQSAFTP